MAQSCVVNIDTGMEFVFMGEDAEQKQRERRNEISSRPPASHLPSQIE